MITSLGRRPEIARSLGAKPPSALQVGRSVAMAVITCRSLRCCRAEQAYIHECASPHCEVQRPLGCESGGEADFPSEANLSLQTPTITSGASGLNRGSLWSNVVYTFRPAVPSTVQSGCYHLPMGWLGPASVSGFVLAGGRSSRMGRDKALMAYGDHTLIEHIARLVERACGSVVLVGCPERYGALPYPAIEDALPGQGPLGGFQAALCASSAEWTLVVACDMPWITVELLESILDAARECAGDCLVPVSPDGHLQPLCALYRRRCLAAISALLGRGVRKMRDAIPQLAPVLLPMPSAEVFRNVNTPQDWKAVATPVECNAHDAH